MTLLAGSPVTAQEDAEPQVFPPDVVAEIQTEMDRLTEGTLQPGMVVWIDTPEYQFVGASGFENLMDETPMSSEGAF